MSILNTSNSDLPTIQSSTSLEEIRSQIRGYPTESLTGQLVRLGSLLKYSQRSAGLGPRLIILTTNTLIYATRLSSAAGFRIGGGLACSGGTVTSNQENSFTFTDCNGKSILLSAYSIKVSCACFDIGTY